MSVLSNEEQLHRADLARKARQLAYECFAVESSDADSISFFCCGFYLQMSFSEMHPLIVFCLAKKLKDTESRKQLETVNELNLHSVLGSHTVNPEVGCYAYRAVHWLDTELTRDRLNEILDRLLGEALRGYERLRV